MRQLSDRPIWIGHAGDLRDPRLVMSAGVEAVVELADNELMAVLPRDLVRLRCPLADDGDSPDWLVKLALDSTTALLRANIPTLVCCSNGLNRSVCVVAASLACLEDKSFNEMLHTLAQLGPIDVSAGFVAQLQRVLDQV